MGVHPVRARFPELPHGAAVLFGGMAEASRPVEDLTITEWAERYRHVSPESGSPWPGPFRCDRAPEIREPQDCLHPDHPARRVTLRWAAQLGKTTIIENWFCYIVDQAPGSMMIVMPTGEEATKLNRIKLQPTIDCSPRIRRKVAPANSRDEAASTTAFKRFAGGWLQIVNAGSSKGLQMVSIKYLAMDEVTGYPRDVDGRGSPRDQARRRQKKYGEYAKEFQSSTPGIVGDCVITADFLAGDRRYRYLPCPHCKYFQPLTPEHLFEADAADGLPAHMKCRHCGGAILDSHKPEMRRDGRWIATRVADGEPPVPEVMAPDEIERWECAPCEGRCRGWQPSYHLWAAYGEKFQLIVEKRIEAGSDTTKLRTLYQQDYAEPYDPGGDALDHEAVVGAARKDPVPARVMPGWAGLLVLSADVQGYGIKWTVWAIGPMGRRQLVDRGLLEGAPDQTDEPWIALADLIAGTWKTASGRDKALDLAGVDSGFATERVYRFCAGRANCWALDGRHKRGLPWVGTPVKREIKDRWGRKLAATMLYPIGLYDVKTEVVASIANLIKGPDSTGAWPRPVVMLPADLCDEAFARELTAERLVDPEEAANESPNQKRHRRGVKPAKVAAREWEKLPGRANDWFDCAVYGFALGKAEEQRRRLDVERWGDLVAEVHGRDAPPPDLFTAAEVAGPLALPRQRAKRKREGGGNPYAKIGKA